MMIDETKMLAKFANQAEPLPKLYVLHWEFVDKSDSGIVGVFNDERRANELYDFAEAHANAKTFYLDTYTLNELKLEKK